MKLSKHKISKLLKHRHKAQTHKKIKKSNNKKKSYNSKSYARHTFRNRKNKHINLRTKTLKKYRGGVLPVLPPPSEPYELPNNPNPNSMEALRVVVINLQQKQETFRNFQKQITVLQRRARHGGPRVEIDKINTRLAEKIQARDEYEKKYNTVIDKYKQFLNPGDALQVKLATRPIGDVQINEQDLELLNEAGPADFEEDEDKALDRRPDINRQNTEDLEKEDARYTGIAQKATDRVFAGVNPDGAAGLSLFSCR